MELSGKKSAFDELGIAVVGMTYDPVETNARFVGKHDIGYPMLTAKDGEYFRELGIFNTDLDEAHRFYGIPYPGIMLVDGSGKIVRKFAEEGYVDRPAIELVLDAARDMFN